jgi:uncharacterized membrane protein (DUF2068 family)
VASRIAAVFRNRKDNRIATGGAARHKNPRSARHRWLELIGVLKLLQGGFFVALGFGLLHLLHRDLYIFALQAVQALHLDPDRRIVAALLDNLLMLDMHRMKQLTALVFVYAALDFIEGAGLVMEKRWAEYFTLILTIALLPLEVVKVIQHPNHWTVGILAANILIVVYLAWLVRPGGINSEAATQPPQL